MINIVFKWIYEKQQISLLSRKRTSICLYWCGAVVFYWTPVATWRQHIPSSLEAACVWHTKRIRMCTHWDLIKALCGGHSRIQTGGRTRWVAVNRSYIRQMFQGPQLNRKRSKLARNPTHHVVIHVIFLKWVGLFVSRLVRDMMPFTEVDFIGKSSLTSADE